MKWILTYFVPMVPVLALAIYLVMLLARLDSNERHANGHQRHVPASHLFGCLRVVGEGG
jgi:hypothetical protein